MSEDANLLNLLRRLALNTNPPPTLHADVVWQRIACEISDETHTTIDATADIGDRPYSLPASPKHRMNTVRRAAVIATTLAAIAGGMYVLRGDRFHRQSTFSRLPAEYSFSVGLGAGDTTTIQLNSPDDRVPSTQVSELKRQHPELSTATFWLVNYSGPAGQYNPPVNDVLAWLILLPPTQGSLLCANCKPHDVSQFFIYADSSPVLLASGSLLERPPGT